MFLLSSTYFGKESIDKLYFVVKCYVDEIGCTQGTPVKLD